ncbi:MAG: TonB-dependent receptor [Bacteroidota bacterium]
MRTLKLIISIPLLILSSIGLAQSGIIRGTVIEDSNGEPLFGVTVQIKSTSTGAITDFDGKFEIRADPGTYDLQASFIGFQAVTVSDLLVEDDEVTVIDQIRLKEDVGVLEEIVVTAEAIKTTETALLTVKRKSANLMDGISAASFRRIGDSDAASAVKRVTGVSVEGGKYVYVRGIGDRYTKTMLNGLDIPGLDPDRNSLQIDIFPTNLIDNMIVFKTASADLPADFTGGVVNIETKDFPEEKILEVSASAQFNPDMHFNDDFLDYERGDTDWLGYDDGTRDLPSGAENLNTLNVDDDLSGQEAFNFSNSFDKNLDAFQNQRPLDYSISLTTGDQKQVFGKNKLGYIISGTYKRTYVHYDDIFFGEYQLRFQPTEQDLIEASISSGVQSRINTLLGGLAGFAYKTSNSKYRFTAMHLQNGESIAAELSLKDNDDAAGKSEFSGFTDNLEYNERSLTNFLLNGEHHLSNDKFVLEWKFSPTFSSLEDPDIRRTGFNFQGQDLVINPGAVRYPQRIWRDLEETNYSGRTDLTYNTQVFNEDAKIKIGFSYTFKERDYEILSYEADAGLVSVQPDWSGDPNEVLLEENLQPNGSVEIQSENILPQNPNEYNSTVDYGAAYISAEINPIGGLKAILGVRLENFVQRHTGRDDAGARSIFFFEEFDRPIPESSNILDDDKVLDAFDFFPSVNLIYSLQEKQNLRASYSRSIARPSFKELSFASILDPISNRRFIGGFTEYEDWDGNLIETFIDNFDLRWELFQDGGQLFSVSAFYKRFEDPIELVQIRVANTNQELQPRNVGTGQLVGTEIEIRKSLDFLNPLISNFSISGNVTLAATELEMSDEEFQARLDFVKEGQEVDNKRRMAGQAPYVVNFGLSYDNFENALEAGLFYNVQGPTITVVGGGIFPDVESEPFHSLNFNLNKRFGENERLVLNFKVNNILDDVREEFFIAHGAEERFFNRFSPGRSFGFGINYSLY